MAYEIIFVSVGGVLAGLIIAYLFSRRGLHVPTKEGRKVKKILNNPELLVEKLNKNGEMVDIGEKLEYKVVEGEDGKRRVALEKTAIKIAKMPEKVEEIEETDDVLEEEDVIGQEPEEEDLIEEQEEEVEDEIIVKEPVVEEEDVIEEEEPEEIVEDDDEEESLEDLKERLEIEKQILEIKEKKKKLESS